MPMTTGKQALLDLLALEGVEVIFGNPGTTELPLMDALAGDTRFRYVLGLQEAVVMAMADGYAQASGRLAVVNLHVTPGLGNAMGMLYDAQKSAAPILVTAGQHEQRFTITEPILYGDLPTLARPLVKWSYEVRRLADLPIAVHRAAKTALAPPTGPVFLSLPGDILTAEADLALGAPSRVAPGLCADRAAIAAAAELLAGAQRPVIMAGDAVAQSDALAEVVALAELLGAPVYAEIVPNTASFPASHPLFHGTVARITPAIRKMLDEHDLLLSIGADLFTLSLPSDVQAIPPGLKIVHLDIDPWELGKNFPIDVGLLGDPKATLPELTAGIAARLDAEARSRIAARRKAVEGTIARARGELVARAQALSGRTPAHPLAVLQAIGAALPDDAVVIEETLSSAEGIRWLMRSNDSKSYYGLRGGGIGWGLPAAMGIKLALPHRPVVALIGDGSAMYTIQGLWTAAHQNIPVVFVILNNASYRILKQRLAAMRGGAPNQYVGMDLVDPAIDFVGLARALGIRAERTATAAGAAELVTKAIASAAPTLIDVEIERG
ncbi:MAG: thiamine pyrophosphate-binding protein [Xanthobacteraceae bacterium]